MEMTTKTKNKPFNLRGLYAITPCSSIQSLSTSELLARTRQVLEGGARIIQYREKQHPAELQQEQASEIKLLCEEFGVTLLINDDVSLAESIEAEGVHLGRDDASIEEARRRLGREAIVGISCYNQLDLAQQAEQQGADYVAFGRFFPSSSKPDAVRADEALLKQALSELSIPVACIGGITADNAKLLVSAGADMLAVIEGVFGNDSGKGNAAENITENAAEITRLFNLSNSEFN